jgi:putative ABC transport system substrate-binding protein
MPSLARPGGNITGISTDVGGFDIWGKRLGLLREASPKSTNARFLTLRSSWEKLQGEAVRNEARQLGISLEGALLDGTVDEGQIRRVFAAMEQDRADALMVIDDAGLFPYRQLIVELASKSRIPAIYAHRIFVEPGGLMTYSFDLAEMYRNVADQIDKILRGEKPGNIPVFQASRYEPQDGQGARSGNASGVGCPSRRGDRMKRREFIVGVGTAAAKVAAFWRSVP